MTRKLGLVIAVAASMFSTGVLASPVGTLDLSGMLAFSNTGITWSASIINADSNTTGIYVPVGGTTPTVQALAFTTEPVGLLFPAQSLLSFPSDPLLAALNVDMIDAGLYSNAGCTASPPAAGQTCTPLFPSSTKTPLSFVNNPVTGSTMTFSLEGVTADGKDTWTGVFTSQFTNPFQTELAALAAGSINTTYNAIITVTPSATNPPSTGVPEPATLAYFLSALVGLAAAGWLTGRKRA